MWQVSAIVPDGSRIEVMPSSSPLSGIVLGRRCPPFLYRSDGGRQIEPQTYRGKALLIDIWSIT